MRPHRPARTPRYIWQLSDWPNLTYDAAALAVPLAQVHRAQGQLVGRMLELGLAQRDLATLQANPTQGAKDLLEPLIEAATLMHDHDISRLPVVGDRGLVAPGLRADLNVIDLEALSLDQPEYVFDLPLGAGRYIQRASGYDATIVNGSVFMEGGEHTGALPGTVLRGPCTDA